MAEGDTNLTNLVLSGDLTVDDDVTVSSDLAVTGDLTVSDDCTVTGDVRGGAFYGPTVTESVPTVMGFQVDGTNPPTMFYVRIYDQGYQAFRNYRMWNGTLTAT